MTNREKVQVEFSVPSQSLHIRHAYCPNGHSLVDKNVKIHGYPSLKVTVRFGDLKGTLFLDPVYGSFDHDDRDLPLPMGKVVRLYCPQCDTDLTDADERCHVCSSPMFLFHLPKGGVIEGCLKKGCFYHKLTIVDSEEQISRLFKDSTLESYL